MNQGVRVAQGVEAAVMIGGDGSEGTAEKGGDAETEIESGIDDVQEPVRAAANLKLGNGDSSMGLKAVGVAAGEGVVYSTRTRVEACNCSPVARTQGVVTRKGMVGEDR